MALLLSPAFPCLSASAEVVYENVYNHVLFGEVRESDDRFVTARSECLEKYFSHSITAEGREYSGSKELRALRDLYSSESAQSNEAKSDVVAKIDQLQKSYVDCIAGEKGFYLLRTEIIERGSGRLVDVIDMSGARMSN